MGEWAAADRWKSANPDRGVCLKERPPHEVRHPDPMRDGWRCGQGCCFVARMDWLAARELRRPV